MDTNTLNKIEFFKNTDQQTILTGKDENGVFYLNQLFEIYQKFFGETCSTCPSKILGYIQKVKSIKNNTMSQTERKYLLKEGAVIQVFGTSEAYSNANLTDEKAEQLLKENPNRAALFIRIPTDAPDTPEEEEETPTVDVNKSVESIIPTDAPDTPEEEEETPTNKKTRSQKK